MRGDSNWFSVLLLRDKGFPVPESCYFRIRLPEEKKQLSGKDQGTEGYRQDGSARGRCGA